MANPAGDSRRIKFGPCVLDLDTRQLFVSDHEAHITPKAFELLAILIEQAPKALTKAQLIDHLWPRTYVSEDALARLVADLRTALGDNARMPRWIRTIHGYGYGFVSDTLENQASASPTMCSLIWGAREFRLREGENVIGRDPDVEILINSQVVSRRHARIIVSDDTARIEDLDSKNGTSVGGVALTGPRLLEQGDVISIGEFELRFQRSTNVATLTRQ